jgi:hypothetical protein
MEISTKATALKLLLFLYLFLHLSNMNLSKQQRQWLFCKKFQLKEPTDLPLMILLAIENDGTLPRMSLLPYYLHRAHAQATLIKL